MKIFNSPLLRTAAVALTLAISAVTSTAAGPEADNNLFKIVATGDNNPLTIIQTSDIRRDRAHVTSSREWNGTESAEFSAWPAWAESKSSEPIDKFGDQQSADLDISGTGNLFSIVQSGEANIAQGTISGFGNQGTIVQSGFQNRAVFSLNGRNNYVAINQKM